MKLLCVIPNYWPALQYGGTVAATHCLNRALAKKGVEVTVYTTNVGLEKKVPVNQEQAFEGVKVTYFSFSRLFGFMGSSGWQFSLKMSAALKNNLPGFDAVFIVDIWNYPASVAAHYCRVYKIPYIIIPSGMLYPRAFFKKIWKKWFYYHLVVKRDLRKAALIQYTCADEKEKTNSFLALKNRAAVIPNGIDPEEFFNLPDKGVLRNNCPYLKDKKIILFVGRLRWIKGLDILLQAFISLAKEINDAHLLIAGNDENGYGGKARGWVKRSGFSYVDCDLTYNRGILDAGGCLGLFERLARASAGSSENARVTFTGILNKQEKLIFYSGSDIFALPSYSENFGMAAVEAMACGLPAIISNKVGIAREIGRNKAGIIVDTNAADLRLALKSLLADSVLREELKVNAVKLVAENYNINDAAAEMIRAYGQLGINK